MPAPVSTPIFFKEDNGHRRTPEACLKYGKASHWVKTCPSSQLLPGCCLDCGQVGHWRTDCPALPRQGRPIPPTSYSTGKSAGSSGSNSQRMMLPLDPSPQQHGGTSSCLGSQQVYHFGWSFSNLWSCIITRLVIALPSLIAPSPKAATALLVH